MNLGFGGLLFVIVLALAGPTALFFHEPQLASILRVLAISFWFMSAGIVHNAILSREMAFDKIGIADLASSAAGYAVAIPCAFAGLGVLESRICEPRECLCHNRTLLVLLPVAASLAVRHK